MSKEIIDIELEEIIQFDDAADMEAFKKFLRQYGIENELEDTTLEYTKKKMEMLVALAEEGENPTLAKNKSVLKRILDNLKGKKEEREALKALREVFLDYESALGEEGEELIDIKELDVKIKDALKEFKKYEHFKAHEEQIAQKWIREVERESREAKEAARVAKREIRREIKREK